MQILVFEDNLMWSSRFAQSLRALGYEPVIALSVPEATEAKAAIVNLGSQKLSPQELVPKLKAMGIHVIAHAGHKEKDLLELGKGLECDTLATNSQITFKLESLLENAIS